MTASIKVKVKHVIAAKMTRKHHCHWPGCKTEVPPARWGCRYHWFKLPMALRHKLWLAYQIKQEETQKPSREYVGIAREIQDWIRNNHSERLSPDIHTESEPR